MPRPHDDRDELLVELGQPLTAVFRDEHEVLDADAALAGEVDPRLDGDDVAGLEHVGRLGAQRRGLVDLDADAVPEPVAERLAEPGCVDQRARGRVGVNATHSRSDGLQARELCFQTERVDLRQPLGDLAHRERPRAVRAVAVDDATRVDHDEHTLLDRAIPGHGVR